LVPVHPAVQRDDDLSLSNPEQLRHALATIELFAELERWPAIPSSIQFAAGVLALITRPPHAHDWIEQARGAAVARCARRFALFFDSCVTIRRLPPSMW
jgi:hypothetical protein